MHQVRDNLDSGGVDVAATWKLSVINYAPDWNWCGPFHTNDVHISQMHVAVECKLSPMHIPRDE